MTRPLQPQDVADAYAAGKIVGRQDALAEAEQALLDPILWVRQHGGRSLKVPVPVVPDVYKADAPLGFSSAQNHIVIPLEHLEYALGLLTKVPTAKT